MVIKSLLSSHKVEISKTTFTIKIFSKFDFLDTRETVKNF